MSVLNSGGAIASGRPHMMIVRPSCVRETIRVRPGEESLPSHSQAVTIMSMPSQAQAMDTVGMRTGRPSSRIPDRGLSTGAAPAPIAPTASTRDPAVPNLRMM